MSTSITSRQAIWDRDIDDEPFHALGRPQGEAMAVPGWHESAKGNNTAYFAVPYVPSNWFSVSESDLSAAMGYLNRFFSPGRTEQVESSMESQLVSSRDQTNSTHFRPAIEYIAETVKGRRTGPYVPVDMFPIARSPANRVIRWFAGDVWVGVADPASAPSPRRLTFVNESQFFPTEYPMDERLDHIFWEAQWEQFETGMDSKFSENLQQLYSIDPYMVLQSLIDRTTGDEAGPEVLAEMFTWISRQEALAGLRLSIVDLLSQGLRNSSALVRDAAALGLAFFDENTAKDYIKQAIENEQVPELRRDLQDLVRSLETLIRDGNT